MPPAPSLAAPPKPDSGCPPAMLEHASRTASWMMTCGRTGRAGFRLLRGCTTTGVQQTARAAAGNDTHGLSKYAAGQTEQELTTMRPRPNRMAACRERGSRSEQEYPPRPEMPAPWRGRATSGRLQVAPPPPFPIEKQAPAGATKHCTCACCWQRSSSIGAGACLPLRRQTPSAPW